MVAVIACKTENKRLNSSMGLPFFLKYEVENIFEDYCLYCRHDVVYKIRISGGRFKIIDFSIGIQIL